MTCEEYRRKKERDRATARRKANPEAWKAYQKKYREANRERLIEYHKQYRAKRKAQNPQNNANANPETRDIIAI